MIDYTVFSMLPGPEIVGEPFWCLMEWKNNRLTGNFFSQQGFCFFLRSQDAETLKKQLPNQHEWVVRGMNRKFFNYILKKHNQTFQGIIPLLLVPPFLGHSKVLTLKITADELRYYANHGKFIDRNFQKAIDTAFNLVNNLPEEMITRRLSIDPFLNHLKDNFQKYPRPYKKLPDVINQYRNAIWADAELAKDEAEELMTSTDSLGQCYTRTFELPEKSSYDITWSIPKLKKVIDTYNLPLTTLSLSILVPLVDQTNIVISHLEKALKNDNPVIVVRYPLSSPSICLVDGNHRVIAKYRAGHPTIQGYLLEPDHHLEAMAFNVHRTLFKFHYNINEIIKYMSLENPTENIDLLSL